MSWIDPILEREGGYVNHPADKGGPTNFGITQATLAAWRNRPVTAFEVSQMSREEAVAIYEAKYVKPFERFANNAPLMALIVDSAVQHGPARVEKWLQAIPSTDPTVNYKLLLRRRIEFYGEIITADPKQAAFPKGWMRRVAEFVRSKQSSAS